MEFYKRGIYEIVERWKEVLRSNGGDGNDEIYS